MPRVAPARSRDGERCYDPSYESTGFGVDQHGLQLVREFFRSDLKPSRP
jgi:hypothetical protein